MNTTIPLTPSFVRRTKSFVLRDDIVGSIEAHLRNPRLHRFLIESSSQTPNHCEYLLFERESNGRWSINRADVKDEV